MSPKAPAVQTVESPEKPLSALVKQFRAARRVSTPLVAIETADPGATLTALAESLKTDVPTLEWDVVRGLHHLNKPGEVALKKLGVIQEMTMNLASALEALGKIDAGSVVFLLNAHRQLDEIANVQALWNLRDIFKLNQRMVVLLGTTFQLPSELAGDVIVFDEPLPTREELAATIDMQYKNAKLDLPDAETRLAALDAVVGLPQFTAEQVVAMALTKQGIDLPALWERKRKAIKNTEGLRVLDAKDSSLDNLKGIDNAVAFMRKMIAAKAFNAIVFIDEGDKAFAGGMSEHSGDSGVAKDQVGTILSYMEDTGSLGVLLAGVAGTGKTELAKATAASSGKPCIVFDLGAMKGGVVGESERTIRAALKVVTATAEGRVLFLMTANKTTLFSPELNRRFPDQFFFDTPNHAGREEIWPVYIKKFGLGQEQTHRPAGFGDGWTGAEIRRACARAALFHESVTDAARYIIPQSVSGRRAIEQLRSEASGRFLSASHEGFYDKDRVDIEESWMERAAAASDMRPGERVVDLD